MNQFCSARILVQFFCQSIQKDECFFWAPHPISYARSSMSSKRAHNTWHGWGIHHDGKAMAMWIWRVRSTAKREGSKTKHRPFCSFPVVHNVKVRGQNHSTKIIALCASSDCEKSLLLRLFSLLLFRSLCFGFGTRGIGWFSCFPFGKSNSLQSRP